MKRSVFLLSPWEKEGIGTGSEPTKHEEGGGWWSDSDGGVRFFYLPFLELHTASPPSAPPLP